MKSSIFTRAFQLLILLAVFQFLASCNNHCIESNNTVEIQQRFPADDFETILLSSDYTVYISHGKADSISVEAESNLLPFVETEIVNSRLEVKTTNDVCLSPRKPIIIRISSKKLSNLNISGTGTLFLDSVISELVKIHIEGSSSDWIINRQKNNGMGSIRDGRSKYLPYRSMYMIY